MSLDMDRNSMGSGIAEWVTHNAIYVVGFILLMTALECGDDRQLEKQFMAECVTRYEPELCESIVDERSEVCAHRHKNVGDYISCMYRVFERSKSVR